MQDNGLDFGLCAYRVSETGVAGRAGTGGAVAYRSRRNPHVSCCSRRGAVRWEPGQGRGVLNAEFYRESLLVLLEGVSPLAIDWP